MKSNIIQSQQDNKLNLSRTDEKNSEIMGKKLAQAFMANFKFDDIFKEIVKDNLESYMASDDQGSDLSSVPAVASSQTVSQNNESESEKFVSSGDRSTKNTCPHKNKPHYAKSMCRNCYSQKGRPRKAECSHPDRPMYAKGMCAVCYRLLYKTQKSSKLTDSAETERKLIEEFVKYEQL